MALWWWNFRERGDASSQLCESKSLLQPTGGQNTDLFKASAAPQGPFQGKSEFIQPPLPGRKQLHVGEPGALNPAIA